MWLNTGCDGLLPVVVIGGWKLGVVHIKCGVYYVREALKNCFLGIIPKPADPPQQWANTGSWSNLVWITLYSKFRNLNGQTISEGRDFHQLFHYSLSVCEIIFTYFINFSLPSFWSRQQGNNLIKYSTANDKSLATNMVSERQKAAPSSGTFLNKTAFS